MCGIIGAIDLERLAAAAPWQGSELDAFARARDGMIHRGPDGAGIWHEPGVLFGHRRLAILDLSPGGYQPMISAAGSALTFNGEIYNYIELRSQLEGCGCVFRSSSDTEVLLQALETWGLRDTLARIRGMYAFAWWEPAARTLHLARDPIGKKPLYVWKAGRRIAFSSALVPLTEWLRWEGVSFDVDPVAIEHFLAGGYIEAPRTVFVQVSKLAAGCALSFGPEGVQEHAARPLPFARQHEPLNGANLDHLDGLLQQSVARRLRSDVPVATFLSGGLDSSLVTALAAKAHPGITAYTVRTEGRNQDEFAVAQRVARQTGVRHAVLDVELQHLDRLPELVRHYGEPFGDASALPTWLISQEAGRSHRVILTGDGGDEVQGGYPGAKLFAIRHLLHDHLHLPTLGLLPQALQAGATALGAGREGSLRAWHFRWLRLNADAPEAAAAQRDDLDRLEGLFQPSLRGALRAEGWHATVARHFRALRAEDELDRALGLDFSLYLPEDLCVKVDVASMAHAVETRAPLLDLDFTDACWQIRPLDRVRPWESKRIVRALLARHLPADCVLGRKQGFSIPLTQWMQDPVVQAQIEDGCRRGLPGLDFLDGAAILKTLEERQKAGQDNGVLAWRLLFLGEWARQVMAAPHAAASSGLRAGW